MVEPELQPPLLVHRFAALAQAYSETLDRLGAAPPTIAREVAAKVLPLLASLVAEASLLPDVEPSDDHLELARTYPTLSVFVDAVLIDDLRDIYADLRRGLHLLDRDRPGDVEDAIWEWRFGYESHWGHHAVSALQKLHQLLT